MFLRERGLLCGMKVVLGRKSIREDIYPRDMIGPWEAPRKRRPFKEKMGLGKTWGLRKRWDCG
jgi:hypothetical protein